MCAQFNTNAFLEEYKRKLKTPEEAVQVVKDGDWVDYGATMGKPTLLDRALARRRDELHDVKVRGNLTSGPIEIVECDPGREHFTYNTWHCSAYERKLCDKGLCFYTPMVFHNLAAYYEAFLTVNVAMVAVPPMDRHGYFNYSIHTGVSGEVVRKADIVILEINPYLPRVHGGYDDCIHISDVDIVVEGEQEPFVDPPAPKVTDIERTIAAGILPYIVDGATMQFGIGSMPSAVGSLLCESDLRDLGMHTELVTDAFLDLYEAGKITNRMKKVNNGKGVFGIAMGSNRLYDWLGDNPAILAYPMAYVNNPSLIAQIDNMVSINSCIAIDLFGQISSESVGTRQISGTGGQLDFLEGAALSKGGKGFICVKSTFTDKAGNVMSSILPRFEGDIITAPRSQAYLVATEYGVVNLVGATTWERAERIVSIAHPDFRDWLIKEAEKMRIWRRSQKR